MALEHNSLPKASTPAANLPPRKHLFVAWAHGSLGDMAAAILENALGLWGVQLPVYLDRKKTKKILTRSDRVVVGSSPTMGVCLFYNKCLHDSYSSVGRAHDF